MNGPIVLAGATGALGQLIAAEIRKRGGEVRAIVRPGTAPDRTAALTQQGATVVAVDLTDGAALTEACRGASCVVSALNGLRETIVDLQTQLVDAAVAAGVPRFMPSDYAADFTNTVPGTNRNFDYRKEFRAIVDTKNIRVTSVMNGMFMDLLNGDAPIVLFPLHRILHWGDPDQAIDLTTMQNTAEYTAAVALDDNTPRWLRIAGEVTTPNQLVNTAEKVSGKPFKRLRPGGIGFLETMIKATRFFVPGKDDNFPPWQGMQYLRDMYSGRAKLHGLDNNRYPGMEWESVATVLARNPKARG